MSRGPWGVANAGAAMGIGAGAAVGLWALGPTPGAGPRAFAAAVIPVALLGLAGTLLVPATLWLARIGWVRSGERQGGLPGLARWSLGFAGAVSAAALLAVLLHRLALAVPFGLAWRSRTAMAFGAWLLLAGACVRGLPAAAPSLRAAASGAALCAVAYFLFRGGALAASPAAPAPPPSVANGSQRPNLALIVLDTTRADHLSLYGYPRPTSPFLEALARDATVYDDAISPAPWTLPAHASLFTGQLPSVHGASTEHRFLDDRFSTLAELLQQAGYDTAGFSSNSVAGSIYNLQQGFAHFDDVWRLRLERRDDPLTRLLPASILRWVETGAMDSDKGAALVNRRVNAWLDRRAAARDPRPFFFFVNYVEAHLPYDAPPAWRSRFLRAPLLPRVEPLTGSDSLHAVFNRMGEGEALSDAELSQLRDLYDAGLAYQDAKLEELVSGLERRGLLDDTLLVVVADHGENLGDHGGLLDHAFSVHQTLVRVPLLVRYPALFPRGVREPAAVSTLSVFPTLLDAARVAPDPAWPPAVAALPHGGTAPDHFAVTEYSLPVFELSLLANEDPGTDVHHFAVRQRAAQDDTHKLVLRSDGSTLLYDLVNDPTEDHPIPAEGREETARLAAALHAELEGAERRSTGASHAGGLDNGTRAALRALGYIE